MNEHRNRYSGTVRQQAVRAYVAGWPIPEITKVYGLSRTALRYWLRTMEIPPRPPRRPRAPKLPQPAPLTLQQKGPPIRPIRVEDFPSVAKLSQYDQVIAAADTFVPLCE